MRAGIVAPTQGIADATDDFGLFNTRVLDVQIGVAEIELAGFTGVPLPAQRKPDTIIVRHASAALGITNRRAVVGNTEFQLEGVARFVSRTPGKAPGIIVIE